MSPLSAWGNPAAAPHPGPADPLAQLLAAVLAYRPSPGPERSRPSYLPHPRRRLPRVRGVVRCSKAWLKPGTISRS